MKKHLTMLALACSLCIISCNTKSDNAVSGTPSTTTVSAATQKNLDAMHGVTKSIESKDFTRLGDFIAADAVDHSDMGDIKGLDSIRKSMVQWTATVDNSKTDVIKELADDDYVMTWTRNTGTYNSAGMGHKAGDKFDMKILDIAKFKDGKAVEHWNLMEPGEVMKMMSAGQPSH